MMVIIIISHQNRTKESMATILGKQDIIKKGIIKKPKQSTLNHITFLWLLKRSIKK